MSLKSKTLGASQISAMTRIFSPSVFKELASKGESPLLTRLIIESKIYDTLPPKEPLRNLFDAVFTILKKKNNRSEYIYKAAITNKILLGAHSLKTSSMISELRVSNCKADVVILNGTSTVYEIKSERDNIERLEAQITAYLKVFAKVNVITGDNHLSAILDTVPKDVGILLLTDRFQISTFREPKDNSGRVEPATIFDSLQLHEARRILELLDIRIQDLPNTQMYQAIREQFVKLKPKQAHAGMVAVLKESRSLLPLAKLIEHLPTSLRSAAFSTNIRLKDHAKLLSAMEVPFCDALNWK